MIESLTSASLQDQLREFENRLSAELVSEVDFIEVIRDDLVHAGGKRLRPNLAFLAGQLLGAEPGDSMRVALAVELLHSASLLHDDLIDDAETRRGAEAAFRRYGNVVSVMSGDFMLAKVLGLLAQTGSKDFTQLMAATATRICEGEVLQFQMASLEGYSIEQYLQIIEGKTAVLFAAALAGVALLCKAPAETSRALKDYGMAYGRAFQMQDDYLDLMGDEMLLGKPVGGDLREGKATYPVLLLLEVAGTEVRDILRRHAKQDDDVARMLALVKEHGTDRAARARIKAEADRAVDALAPFEDSEAKAMLIGLANKEIERVR